jgi:hypothetical protein
LDAWLLGSLFVLFPAWALWRQPARLTRVLCIAGVGIGLAFMPVPVMDGDLAQGLFMALRNALVLAGVGAAVQFAFEYARPGRRSTWVYFPVGAYWLMLDWRLLAPGATGLVPMTSLAGGVLLATALASILVVLLRAWIRSRHTAQPQQIGRVFLFTLAGLLPPALVAVSGPLWGLTWPGGGLWSASLLLVPYSWSRAAVAVVGDSRPGDPTTG